MHGNKVICTRNYEECASKSQSARGQTNMTKSWRVIYYYVTTWEETMTRIQSRLLFLPSDLRNRYFKKWAWLRLLLTCSLQPTTQQSTERRDHLQRRHSLAVLGVSHCIGQNKHGGERQGQRRRSTREYHYKTTDGIILCRGNDNFSLRYGQCIYGC